MTNEIKVTEEFRINRCPLCGNVYRGASALSRTDGETLICPDCGTRQALESIDVDPAEQEEILEAIHRYEQSATAAQDAT